MAFGLHRGSRVLKGVIVLAAGLAMLGAAQAASIEADLRAPLPAVFPPADRAMLLRFYGARDFRPAWQANPDAGAVLAAMRGAAADGLDPSRYEMPDTSDPAAHDIALTDRLLQYAQDLRRGEVVPQSADKMVGIERPGFDPASSLAQALAGGQFRQWLANLPPAHPEYARLKTALAHYRAIAAKGGWPGVPAVRKIELEAGNPRLAALEKRLAAEDPELPPRPDIPALEAAVKRFQAANGLVADGVVGPQTIHALNIPASERAAQIEANMERWRWLPHRFPPRYVAVNAADATLKAVDDGRTVLTSRVIVGKPKTPTAIFNADAIAITVNPPWKVPASIARNEILPKLRRNPGYLAKHNMVIKAGRIEQRPGEDNSLGYLKVEMPNRFTAYLHDTNARSLFARDERHLSHGCIRVENIRPLASWLLTGDTEKGRAEIDTAIDSGVTKKIALDRPVPVYVLYWTAIAKADGGAEFRPDIYGRDERLIAALQPAGTQAASANTRALPACRA